MKILTSSLNTIKELQLLNINCSEDLIHYLPYRYENFNYSNESNLNDKQRVVIFGKIVSNIKTIQTTKMTIIKFSFVSSNDRLYDITIFNQPFLKKMLNISDRYTIIGTYSSIDKSITLSKIRKGEIPLDSRFQPVYHLTNNINDTVYRNLVKKTLNVYSSYIKEVLPIDIIRKYHLLSHKTALEMVHFPKNNEELHQALRTIKFEECLEYCFKNRLIREENKKLVKIDVLNIDLNKVDALIKSLPFKPTDDQSYAIKDIIRDMQSKSLMYRLLQGDVGTGKTLVAAISLYANYLRGKQGVLMTPTDSLARQHYLYLKSLFKDYNIKIHLLVGGMSEKDKKLVRAEIENGTNEIIVGTHTVFSRSTLYSNLGLAIIDEQHRFGVNQRNLLANKGENVDLLLMSATPIPRTLSLSIYGDLDVSTLQTFPNSSRNVKTVAVDFSSQKIKGLINYCLERKRQVFIVCPKIISKDLNKDYSLEKVFSLIQEDYPNDCICLHGKMKNEEKINALEEFKTGKKLILVSTTVIELGIDIKSAGGIIVYNANSFGLASLHQLRGRVGRDGNEGYCLLVDYLGGEKAERLHFLEKCNDGFEIAEEDMRLRGPGDFSGLEQSGFPSFNSLNIVSDFKMFEIARDECSIILSHLNEKDYYEYYLYVKEKMDKSTLDYTLFD